MTGMVRPTESSEDEREEALNAAMLKTTVCRHWSKGHCRFGEGCGFAHGGGELRKPLKTALCRHFEQGKCRKGDHCGFAHGAVELGTPQPELLTIDSQEPLDPLAASLPTSSEGLSPNKILVLSMKKKVWRYCTIIDEEDLNLKVHYDGYSNAFDEWLPIDSNRIAAAGSIDSVINPAQIGAKVIVLSRRKRIWRECTVVESEPDRLKVHYDGYKDDYDEYIARSSDRLRNYDSSRLIGKKKTTENTVEPEPEPEPVVVVADKKPSLKTRLRSIVTRPPTQQTTATTPEDLWIFCNHPTGMQAEGHYTLSDKIINGMPVWECVGTTKLVYSSHRGAWMVGVKDWVAKNNGWLSCKQQHGGRMPQAVVGWRSYLTPTDPWLYCDAVVSLGPERPTPSPSLSAPDSVSESGMTPAWTSTPPPYYDHIPSPSNFTYQTNSSFNSSIMNGAVVAATTPGVGGHGGGGVPSPTSMLQHSVSSVGSLSVSRHDPYAF